VPGITTPVEPEWVHSNWQSYCVRLPGTCDQKQTMQALLDRGISTRRGIMCAHREPAYQQQPWRSPGTLRASEQAQETAVILPLYHELSLADQEYIVEQLRAAVLAQVPCEVSL